MTTPEAVAAPAAFSCSLCQSEIEAETGAIMNGNPVCGSCAAQVKAELAREQAIGARFPLALTGGLAGALIGALVWAVIVVLTDYEVGYVAVLVGFLAGQGVKLGASKARGQKLQILAAALALFGLVIAKYFIFAHLVVQQLATEGVDVGYFSPRLFGAFGDFFAEMLSPFDLLWVAIALGAAWRVPAASKLNIQ